VVSLLILIAGIQAIKGLTVRQYPRSDNAEVTITTAYIGASAELVRGFITTPIERAVSGVDGVDYVESSSAQSISTIKLRLKLNYDPIKALSEINSKVTQVRGDLPPEAEVPVINVESADSAFASAYLSFTSDILEPNQVTDFLVRVVQPRLGALDGVQRAEVLGANSVDDFKNLAIKAVDGAVVRLKDVAVVELGSDSYETVVRYNGENAIFMGIWPLPNSNTLDVIAGVRAELDDIKSTLPTGMSATMAYDASEYIQSSIIFTCF